MMSTRKSSKPNSTSGFTRINDSVHFREAKGLSADGEPSLILFLSWGGAPLRLAAKYTDHYEKMFPSSPLLLLQTEFIQILCHTETSQDLPLAPALDILQKYIANDEADSGKGRILVHLFSNGGSYKLVEIAKRYRAKHGRCVPIDTMIVDSAPGISTIIRSLKALSYALPKLWIFRWPLQVLLMLFLILQRTIERIVLGDGLMRIFRRQMNWADIIDKRSKRCYIFSPTDELVGYKDVQDHAAEARNNGYQATEELFEGSAHVAHMRSDPRRYWSIVEQTWNMPLPGS